MFSVRLSPEELDQVERLRMVNGLETHSEVIRKLLWDKDLEGSTANWEIARQLERIADHLAPKRKAGPLEAPVWVEK